MQVMNAVQVCLCAWGFVVGVLASDSMPETVHVQSRGGYHKVGMLAQVSKKKQNRLSVAMGGRIALINKFPGELVKQGEVLLSLDNKDRESDLSNIQKQVQSQQQVLRKLGDQEKKVGAQVLKFKHAYALAQGHYSKQRQQLKSATINAAHLEELSYKKKEKKALLLEAQYQQVAIGEQVLKRKIALESLQSDEVVLKKTMEKSILKAPYSGVVERVFVEKGQTVNPNEALVGIGAGDQVSIRAVMSHADGPEIKQFLKTKNNKALLVEVKGKKMPAVIEAILPRTTSGWLGMDILLTADDNEKTLVTELMGSQELPLTVWFPNGDRVFDVPASAVKDQSRVYRLNKHKKIEEVAVTVLGKSEKGVVVKGQLRDADQVLVNHKKSLESSV